MRLINDIRQIPDTGKLVVVWQKPSDENAKDAGERFVVGEILYNNEFEQINYYDNEDIKKARELGFRELYVFSGKEGMELKNNEISTALARRTISKDRGDFEEYLEFYSISHEIKDQLNTITLLSSTGRGKNHGDGYSFFPDIEKATLPFQTTFEIAGHRHSEGMKAFPDKLGLQGEKVILKTEESNQYDRNAIKIFLGGLAMGYVPKGLNHGLHKFLKESKVDAFIARVNGTVDRPNLMVLVKVS
jgi:hypothetical protein